MNLTEINLSDLECIYVISRRGDDLAPDNISVVATRADVERMLGKCNIHDNFFVESGLRKILMTVTVGETTKIWTVCKWPIALMKFPVTVGDDE